MAALSERVMQLLEPTMQQNPYKSDFARKYYEQGQDQALQDALVRVARSKLALASEDEAILRNLRGDDASAALDALLAAVDPPATARVLASLKDRTSTAG